MNELPRSPLARGRAERALVWLLHELRDEDPFLVVLGGLVPEVLTQGDGATIPQHLGTTDVDMLLITHVDTDAQLGCVEDALERLGFRPDSSTDGWRWRGVVDGAPIVIEFLCDLVEHRNGESIRPAGCRALAAANLRGTGYVEKDFDWRELRGVLADGRPTTVNVRFAGLEGYLVSKCVAVRTRAAAKDYYDLAYVLLHNHAGGPEQAARRLRAGSLAEAIGHLRGTFLEIRERYRRPTDDGPRFYAEQALQVDPEADAALLRADAVDAVARFLIALESTEAIA